MGLFSAVAETVLELDSSSDALDKAKGTWDDTEKRLLLSYSTSNSASSSFALLTYFFIAFEIQLLLTASFFYSCT